MAKRKSANIKPDDLTPREGKTLRYFVGRKRNGDNQTTTDECIIENNSWTDLPHSHSQAVMTVSSLVGMGLLLDIGAGWHTPSPEGIKLIADANKAKMWQAAPPPSTTNNPQHINFVLTNYNSSDKHRPTPKPPEKIKPAAKRAAKAKPKPKAKPKAKALIRIKKASK